MNASASDYCLFVGVDIAAASFAATWSPAGSPPQRARTFPQTPEGFAAFQAALASTAVPPAQTLIVLEATGSYWITLAVTLHQAGYAVSVVNPAHVHAFGRSLPRRAKTDALDAQLLTLFAVERQPSRWTPPEQVYHELRQRLLVRDGLLTMRQQARNQRHALEQWPVTIPAALAALDTVVTECERQLETLETEIATVLQEGAWAESAALLGSIKGIGLITSAWLLVGTLNFTACVSAEAAAAYAGVVPLARESGTSVRGRRQIGHAGNARLRTALYMATLSAARHNPVIRGQYERLRAAGKPTKVARCACAHKLLRLAYAVVTKGQAFDPHYGRQSG
ncbi:IS110 family transposase [Kouleothrix sp.]|uniref:IS110 family transposase n=1 Tax=Kouleothrix sp. TaxID=2779161 RepID=UPI00391C29E3